jgi:hypothetical protein
MRQRLVHRTGLKLTGASGALIVAAVPQLQSPGLEGAFHVSRKPAIGSTPPSRGTMATGACYGPTAISAGGHAVMEGEASMFDR